MGAETIRPTCPIRGQKRVFSIIVSSKVIRAGAELRALARGPGGRRFVGLGFSLFVFVLFSGNGGGVFEPVTAPGNGDGLGAVQEAVRDSTEPARCAEDQLPLRVIRQFCIKTTREIASNAALGSLVWSG